MITIGIFSAIYFVLNFICMLISGLHPLVWILMPMNIAIVTGIPVLLLCAKVQKFGAVLLMGSITGLIYYVKRRTGGALSSFPTTMSLCI